jgi:hypothetical protein
MLEVSAHQACRRGVPAMARQMRDPSSCTRTGSAALSAYGKREGAAESAGNDCVPAAAPSHAHSLLDEIPIGWRVALGVRVRD